MKVFYRLLLLFFLFVILPLGLYGLYAAYRESVRLSPRIVKTLIEPYAEALKTGDFDRACNTYTSSQFRKVYSLEEYARGWKENRDEFGALSSIALRKDGSFQSAGNLFTWRKFYRGYLNYYFEKREVWVCWEVVEEDGAFKIDATFQEFHERLDPRVF